MVSDGGWRRVGDSYCWISANPNCWRGDDCDECYETDQRIIASLKKQQELEQVPPPASGLTRYRCPRCKAINDVPHGSERLVCGQCRGQWGLD